MIAVLPIPLLLAAAPTQSAAPTRPLLALRGDGRGVQENLALRGGGRGVKPSSNKAGTSSVVGGVLLHLACGAAMATAEDTCLALLAQMAGMPLGPLLEKRAGPTGAALLATVCIGTALAGKLGATDCVADLCGAQLSTVLLGLGQILEREEVVTTVELCARAAERAFEDAPGIKEKVQRVSMISVIFSPASEGAATEVCDRLRARTQ